MSRILTIRRTLPSERRLNPSPFDIGMAICTPVSGVGRPSRSSMRTTCRTFERSDGSISMALAMGWRLRGDFSIAQPDTIRGIELNGWVRKRWDADAEWMFSRLPIRRTRSMSAGWIFRGSSRATRTSGRCVSLATWPFVPIHTTGCLQLMFTIRSARPSLIGFVCRRQTIPAGHLPPSARLPSARGAFT